MACLEMILSLALGNLSLSLAVSKLGEGIHDVQNTGCMSNGGVLAAVV